MGEPDLSDELRRRAEEAAEEMIRAAETEAARISAEANARMKSERYDVLSREEDAYRAGAQARVAAVRQEAMHASLLARTRVVERVLERVVARVPEMVDDEGYRALVFEEVVEALSFVGEEGTVVRCTPKLAPVLRAALAERPGVTVEPTDSVGHGFVAVGENGAVRVDGTLEARVARLAPSLAIEIHRRLEARQDDGVPR